MGHAEVRIIAGKWRGRKLKVLDINQLRPTPDRVRETVFNWLAPIISGAHCLDLFAGTGVLGFEALSRGASSVVMIDASMEVITQLQKTCKQLGVENAALYCASAPHQLRSVPTRFDIVFLDPPYQSDLLFPSCFYLETNEFLADSAYIYLESPQKIHDNELPLNWRLLKSQQAGQVFYHLAKREK